MLERISIDPRIMHGKPCIKGTRIPVYMILDLLAAGTPPGKIISDEYYPDLTLEDVYACIAFANQYVKNEEFLFFEAPGNE
jgi:uncharacterized protein (DUF433 family)